MVTERTHIDRVAKEVPDIADERVACLERCFPEVFVRSEVKLSRLAASTFRHWTPPEETEPEALERQLTFFGQGLEDGADPLHVVYELLPKEGYSLNSEIETWTVGASIVHRIADEELKGLTSQDATDQEETRPLSSPASIATETLDALPLDGETVFICQDAALDDSQKLNLALQCVLKTI